MCSIIGMTGQAFTVNDLLERLKRMEYRGYDSFGYWDDTTLYRRVGSVQGTNNNATTKAIGHTRWATHGGVSEANAHPHRAGKTTIVHNGIIDNWRELRSELEREGATFQSDTDSELIAWFVELQRKNNDIPTILHQLTKKLRGTFATVISIDGDNNLYAAKRGSPLLLGTSKQGMFAASDIYAFSDVTNKAIVFDDDEYAVLGEKLQFYKEGAPVEKEVKEFSWVKKEVGLGQHEHYMHKEIHEQPTTTEILLEELKTDASYKKLREKMLTAKKIIFTACGTAYFASLIGSMTLHYSGIEAQALIASEFEHFATIPEGTLVIAVSQSGETMDVIKALQYAKEQGADISSIVNVPFSSIERLSSVSVKIHAGQEIAVASTKAFTNQVVTILSLAGKTPENIPRLIAETLHNEETVKTLVKEVTAEHLYVLGRRFGYPVAREIALKIKEVSYIHAEGMMAGELKHGTIALIEKGTPVLGIVFDNDPDMRSSLEEVRARGARVITIGTRREDDICLEVKDERIFSILATIIGQLFAYHLAKECGCNIDKPRNLAKSVTV